jgi:hypothetical protein
MGSFVDDFMKLFGQLARMDAAWVAIKFIVLLPFTLSLSKGSCDLGVTLHPLACGLAQGSRLVNFFENTRDCAVHNLILSPRAFQKNFRSNHPTLSASEMVGLCPILRVRHCH